MKIKRILRALLILSILSLNVGCDQISKNIIRQEIEYNEQISLINNYLTLTKVENAGAFLSVGNSLPQSVKIIFLTIFPLLILGLALIFLMTNKDLPNLTVLGISFVVGGGIGNIYDRIIYGSVTDFLHIDFIVFQTGIFNMADVSIMVGMFFILFGAYYKRQKMHYKTINNHRNV